MAAAFPAEKTSYLENVWLLLNGELPTKAEYAGWEQEIKLHTMVRENVKKLMDGFNHDAHPMGMLVSTVAARTSTSTAASSTTRSACRSTCSR